MNKHFCIIANSPERGGDIPWARAREADVVIVADGALRLLSDSMPAHVVCGDFDSISVSEAKALRPDVEIAVREDQNSNDLEKSIVLALDRGATEIDVLCGWGGRMDQSLTTLSVLERFSARARMALYYQDWTCRILCANSVSARCQLQTSANETVSLIPRSASAVVSINNVRWPLARHALISGSHGVSNQSFGGLVSAEAHDGIVALCHQSS